MRVEQVNEFHWILIKTGTLKRQPNRILKMEKFENALIQFRGMDSLFIRVCLSL